MNAEVMQNVLFYQPPIAVLLLNVVKELPLQSGVMPDALRNTSLCESNPLWKVFNVNPLENTIYSKAGHCKCRVNAEVINELVKTDNLSAGEKDDGIIQS